MDRKDLIVEIQRLGYELSKKKDNVISFTKFVDGKKILHKIEILTRGKNFFITIMGGKFTQLMSEGYNFSVDLRTVKHELKLKLNSLNNIYPVDKIDLLLLDINTYNQVLENYFNDMNKILSEVKSGDTYMKFSSHKSSYYHDYGCLLKILGNTEIGNKFIDEVIRLNASVWGENSKYEVFHRALVSEDNLTPEKYQELRKRILEVEDTK